MTEHIVTVTVDDLDVAIIRMRETLARRMLLPLISDVPLLESHACNCILTIAFEKYLIPTYFPLGSRIQVTYGSIFVYSPDIAARLLRDLEPQHARPPRIADMDFEILPTKSISVMVLFDKGHYATVRSMLPVKIKLHLKRLL